MKRPPSILTWRRPLVKAQWFTLFGGLCDVTFLITTTVAILAYIFRQDDISADVIAGAIVAYLLMLIKQLEEASRQIRRNTVLMVFDSMTQEVVAAVEDERTVGLKEKFTKWGSAEDAFIFWADRVRLFLDQAHGVKGQ